MAWRDLTKNDVKEKYNRNKVELDKLIKN